MKTAGKIKKSLLTRRKSWISLLNSASIGKKNAVNQVNFHLYHYANNNPITYTDPDGRMSGAPPEAIKRYEQIQQQRKNAVAGKVAGQKKYGKVSDDLIELLKRIETPKPDKDGKIGLHMPGDGVLDEYNTDSGPLMNKIKNSNDKSKAAITKIFKEHKITYPGLPKRREAEAKVYTEGDYSEDFSW